MTWLAVVLLFVLACPGDLYAFHLPVKPGVLLAGACLAALRILRAGRPNRPWRLLYTSPLGWFALFLLMSLVSTFRTTHMPTSIAFLILYSCALLAALSAGEAKAETVLGIYGAAIGLNVLLSVAAHFTGVFAGFVNEGAVPRFGGFYGYPSPLAGAAGVYLLIFLNQDYERAQRSEARMSPLLRAIGWLAVAAATWALWQARSRGVPIVLLVVSAGLLAWHAAMKVRGRSSAPIPLWPLFTIALSLVLLTETVQSRGSAGIATLNGRVPVWREALGAIAARPLLGYGPGDFRNVFSFEQGQAWHFFGTHNSILDACLYAGIPGGLFYACFLAGMVIVAARRFLREPTRNGTHLIFVAFCVLLSMTDPLLMRWPYSSQVVLLILAAKMGRPVPVHPSQP